MPNLRLRDDLEARATEEEGVRYFDVADPRSGASMRLYEHEWLLARRLDGAGSYQEVAGWAEAHVGFHPSPSDIADYARALAGLGFFDEPDSVEQVPLAPAPPPRNEETTFEDLGPVVQRMRELSAAPEAPQRPPLPAPKAPPTLVEAQPARQRPPQATAAAPPVPAAARLAPVAPPAPPTLVDSAPPTVDSPGPSRSGPAAAASSGLSIDALEMLRRNRHTEDAIETTLPGGPPPGLGALPHAAITAPGMEVPPEVQSELRAGARGAAPIAEPSSPPPSAPSLVALQQAAGGEPPQPPAIPATGSPARYGYGEGAPVVPLESMPTGPRLDDALPSIPPPPRGSATMMQPPSLIAPLPPLLPDGPSEPAPSRAGLWGLLGLLLLLGAFALGYLFVVPAVAPVQVRAQSVAPAHDVVRYAESKGEVKASAPVPLSFRQTGKVADVVPVGTAVTPGKTVATLDSYQQLQKELADVRDRESFYEAQLKAAQAKGKKDAVKLAQTKVTEKRTKRLELEDKVAKARVVGTSAGTVATVRTKVGAVVGPGETVLTVIDKRLSAEVKMAPADVPLFKPGAELEATTSPGDGREGFLVKVTGIEGDLARLDLDERATPLPAGTQLNIVQRRVPRVVSLPPSALTRTPEGGFRVWVLAGEVVHARPVTVVEQTPSEVLVSGETFLPGERFVVEPPATLRDGQKATTAP